MTLLTDLNEMAQVLDGLAAQHRAKGNLDGVVECDFRAARLREHAKRLQSDLQWYRRGPLPLSDTGERVREVIERINGGPVTP